MLLNQLSLEALMSRAWGFLGHEHLLTLAVLSPDLIVVRASEKFREYQEEPTLSPIGKHASEVLWELVGAEEALLEVLSGKSEVFSVENINRDSANGATTYLTIRAIALSGEEPGNGLLLVIEDTTATSKFEQELVHERNQLRLTKKSLSLANEELQKLNRLKSLFLSIAAHDLRSPLATIMGYTELVLRDTPPDNENAREYLSTILSLVDTMNRLVADFLDLGTLERGNLKIHPKPCDLNRMVFNTAEIMRGSISDKKVLIEIKAGRENPEIYADPDRIQQILFNLISNAIKYTGEGGQIRIKTGTNGSYGYFSVADNGPGIPKSELPRLFELYHRTEAAQQSIIKGLGLGLFIVKALVDLHNGQISVHSELGKGTEFTVSIPLCADGAG